MPLKKGLTILTVVIVLISSITSVYFLFNIFLGVHFSLDSYSIEDYEGFPSIEYDYSSSDYVEVKMFDPQNNLIDSDYFFSSKGTKNINFGNYKQTISSGKYNLKAYTVEGDQIFSKSFTFDGPNLVTQSCQQKWWIKGDETILIGLTFYVYNSGDAPIYPYSVDVITDEENFSGLVLPSTIDSGEAKTIDCSVYKEGEPQSSSFTVNIKDIDGGLISTNTFDFDIKNSVETKYFAEGLPIKISVPYPEFLFDYYSNLERITDNDYSYYVFDPYDDLYLDIFINRMISGGVFGELSFNSKSNTEKVNFIGKFVQYLEYKEDIATEETNEYANYPIETLFNRDIGCDCEDKSILAASFLDNLGFEVALIRLPNHMSVGVKLGEDEVPKYEYYRDDYYYLETTNEESPIGFVPSQYRSLLSESEIYEISDRPYLSHIWINNVLTIYTKTELGNFVKVEAVVENYGRANAENIIVEGVFVTTYGIELNSETISIASLDSGKKKKITFSVDIPSVSSTFESRLLYDGNVINIRESSEAFT